MVRYDQVMLWAEIYGITARIISIFFRESSFKSWIRSDYIREYAEALV